MPAVFAKNSMVESMGMGLTFAELLLIIVIVLNLAIGLFVLVSRPRHIINRSFALAVLGTSLWSLGLTLMAMTHQFAFYDKVTIYGFLILLTGFLLFARTFPNGEPLRKRFFFAFVPIIFLACVTPLNLIIQSADFSPDDNIVPTNGPLFPLFAIICIGTLVGSVILFIRTYRKALGVARQQMNYFVFGLIIFLLSAGLFDVFLPSIGIFQLNFLGPISSIIFIGLTAYAIVRHELLDIRIIIQRSLIYTVLLVIILSLYLGLIALFGLILGTTTNVPVVLSAGITMLLGIGGVPIIRTYFQKWSDAFFFKNPYDYAKVLHSLSRILYTSLEKDAIVSGATEILTNTFKTDYATFHFDAESRAHAASEPRIAGFRTAHQPIMFEDTCIGVLSLGPKKSSDAYTNKDAQLIATFAFQAAIALSKAELHAKVQEYNEHLTELVEERTNEIHELQEEQKDAMITISHNLQTPLAIIRAEIELLTDYSEHPDQLQAAQKSIDRVSGFIRQLLRVVRFEHSLDTHDMVPVSLSDLLREQIEYFEVMAEDKGIKLTTKIAEGCAVEGNKKLLDELVINIAANAMHYRSPIRRGRIAIELLDTYPTLTLTIRDNGIGIAEKDLPHIFDRFYRAPHGPDSPIGSGLGLAIAKQIVVRHHGSIDVSSTLGEGTTFSIQFPKLSR